MEKARKVKERRAAIKIQRREIALNRAIKGAKVKKAKEVIMDKVMSLVWKSFLKSINSSSG